jgi:hypothetical protein
MSARSAKAAPVTANYLRAEARTLQKPEFSAACKAVPEYKTRVFPQPAAAASFGEDGFYRLRKKPGQFERQR